jgi:hypothetical protein
MRAQEFIQEQKLNEGVNDAVDRLIDKVFGPAGEKMQPGEFERKVGKIPASPNTKQLQKAVADYLAKADIEREAEELAWRNKTSVEKIKHYLIQIAAVVFSVIDPEKLGRALGDLIFIIIKAIINALLKRS